MNTDTLQPAARSPLAGPVVHAPATPRDDVRGHPLADYVMDVFFVVLLAAPFVIFKAPASVEEAVVPAHAQVADAAYGPE